MWEKAVERLDRVFRLPEGTAARVLPYVVIVLLTGSQSVASGPWPFWAYAIKTAIGAWIVLSLWSRVEEWKWSVSWEAIGVGVLAFGIWVGLDPYYPKLSSDGSGSWNPFAVWGTGSATAWGFVAIRILGSAIVIPPIEEACFRSFLYRYLQKEEFRDVPLSRWHWKSALIVAVIFGVVHREWLTGILCGLGYQWLVCRRGHLGDAMVAHGVTNLLLGLWVVTRHAWVFW